MKKHDWQSITKILIKSYPKMRTDNLAEQLGIPISTIYGKAAKLGLKKDEQFLLSADSGRLQKGCTRAEAVRTQFKKGHIPSNKGKKQSEYMTAGQIAKTVGTRFSKGHIPVNHKPVGYERVNVDGYIEIKVAEPNVFRAKHRLIWEEHNGPIPKGFNIQFLDGNRQNVSPDNLYLISRSEQLKTQNSMYARYPEELQKVIKLKGALARQINKLSKSE